MLSSFARLYKYRKVVLILRLVILALFAPYSVKTLQKIQVEESTYLPQDVESIKGNDIVNENFNASFGSGLQVVMKSKSLTREDFLELQSISKKFVDAGYAYNFSTPIEKATNILIGYGSFLSYQAFYENLTITAMYVPIEVYVGVRSQVYSNTHNHTIASEEALNQSIPIANHFSILGNRSLRVEAFHSIRLQEDPNVLASNPLYYADAFVHQIAANFGPYVISGARYTHISDRRNRDSSINSLLNATIPATADAINDDQNAIRDLFTRPVNATEIASKAYAKGYVKNMVLGLYAPSKLNPLYILNRLGVSIDLTTAYADINIKSSDEDFIRSIRDRFESIDKPKNVELTGIDLMRIQISDEAKEKTKHLHLRDILTIMIVLAIMLRALPASIGPILIIGSAIVISEGILYRLNELFDVAITQMSLSVMITAMLGAGVDYTVFMSSRYVEERSRGRSKEDAIYGAVEHAGRSLLTSGGTIAIAFGVLSLSSFELLQGLGIAVALGIAISVLSALILMPVVFGMLGDKFFRPRKMIYKRSRFYHAARRVISHKKATLIAILIPFGALSYVALQADTSYDMIALMPDVPSKEGVKTLIDKFGTFMMPVLVIVYVGEEDNATLIGLSDELDSKISSIRGVFDVRSFAHPLSYKVKLDTLFRNITAERMRTGFYSNGRLMEVVIISYNPFTKDAFNVVKEIRAMLSDMEYEHYVTGVAAMYYDISRLVNEDFNRLMKIVIVSIIIFLTLVFGSILIPLRLEGTVLLNIGGTLGLLYLILKLIDMPLGRIIPISLFVVLNGLGMDYDIFLVTRILEEKHRGLEDDDAIIEAVTHTMRVITACGIIMATSFALLITTGFPFTIQMGLGFSMAVIFDTFIMRAFFVPAFMSIAGKYNRRAPKVLKKLAVYEVE